MAMDVWQLRAAFILISIAVLCPLLADGYINVTASINRVINQEDCTHWGMYWDDAYYCSHCMYQTSSGRSRRQRGCDSSKLGESIYEEVDPRHHSEAVSRCDVGPLEGAGVRATCTYNTLLYLDQETPTAHPGALCYFTCADGYIPVGEYITYIECSRCTTKGQFCQWNQTLDETLCHPVPTATNSPPLPQEHKILIVVLSVAVLCIVIFIIAIYYRHCRKCIRRRPRVPPEEQMIDISSERAEDTCNASDPLFTGEQVDTPEQRVNGDQLKSVESNGSDESGYSSNADRQVALAGQKGPSINNINNYYHQVNMSVTGDIGTVNIRQSQSSTDCTSKPSAIDLSLGDQSEVCVEHIQFAESLRAVDEGKSSTSGSPRASINSTPVCDHHLNGVDTETFPEDTVKPPDSEHLAFSCVESVAEPTLTNDMSSSFHSDTPPVTILPKQGNLSGRVNSRCITKDSGIATVDSGELASIAEELSAHLPTPHLHQLPEQEDVVQLPADNLNSLPTSTSWDSNPADVVFNLPQDSSLEQKSHDPAELFPLPLPDSSCGFSDLTNGKQRVDDNKNLLAVSTSEAPQTSSLELEMPSIDNVSLRQHPDGNSDDLPALDAHPRPLIFEESVAEDSLIFSNFDPTVADSEESELFYPPDGHRLEPQHPMGKTAYDDVPPAELKLVGPEAINTAAHCPRPLTENPPVDGIRLPYYHCPGSPLHAVYPVYPTPARYAPQPTGYVYAQVDSRLADMHPPAYDDVQPQYPNYIPCTYGDVVYPLPYPHPQMLPPRHRQPTRMRSAHMAAHQIPAAVDSSPHGARQPPPVRHQQPSNQNATQQVHHALSAGDLIIKANRVDELVVVKQRTVNGSAADACSIIKETSLFPQQGTVQVESDSIGTVLSRTTDDINTPERSGDAASS